MRLFVGIEIDDTVRERIAAFVGELDTPGGLRLIEPIEYHITLKFLGQVESERVSSIARAMERSVVGISAFSFRVAGLGAFPSNHRPRVLWIGAEGADAGFRRLFNNLEAHFAEIGFPPETRSFVPHLTVAKLKFPSAFPSGFDFEQPADFGSSAVSSVTLFQSRPATFGSRYESLRRVSLPRE